jgi:hypothetical protein
MTVLRVDTIAGTGTTFGPTLEGNLEFNSQNYIVLPKGTSAQEGVLRTTADVVGTGRTYYDNLVLAMPFNEATGFRDVSSRNRNPGAYGNVAISTAQSKYYGSSAYFDGTGDYLTLENSRDFYFGSENFTIEGWINIPTVNSTYQTIFVAGYPFQVYTRSGTIESYFNDSDDTSTYIINTLLGPSNSITANTWSHFAVVRNGSTFTCYVNGTSTSSKTSSGSIALPANNPNIGAVSFAVNVYPFQGYMQDLRIYKGLAKYTANFTPPERIAEIGVGFKAGQLRYNTDSNKVELYDGNQWTEVQSSRPDLNGGARGVFSGGTPANSNIIDYITISSTGDAIDFGDLTVAKRLSGSCASSTRGLFGGGFVDTNTIDYITISSTGNALDFGDLTVVRLGIGGCSNSTRGLFAGGRIVSPATAYFNIIDYVTIASTGNAQDFGDLTLTRSDIGGTGCASPVRGIFGGGYTPTAVNVIDYVTISSLGNASDFGDLTIVRSNLGVCSNATRGLFGGGLQPSIINTIDYIIISTLGNAVKFGELTTSRHSLSACSSSTRGVFGGGQTPTEVNTIDYVTISAQGNAVDFGDLTLSRRSLAGLSNAHGGL